MVLISQNNHAEPNDLISLSNLWRDCELVDDDIGMRAYIAAYDVLRRFIAKMGFLFGFVEKDLSSKLRTLERVMDDSESNYSTAELLFSTEQHPRSEHSGSVALVRLHRAMEFVLECLDAVLRHHDHAPMGPPIRNSFDHTLGPHLPRLVNVTARVAFSTLPRRRDLLRTIAGDLPVARALSLLSEAHERGKMVYGRIQAKIQFYGLDNVPQY